MKVFVIRSSQWSEEGEVREYNDLDECITTLLETEDFGKFAPEIIVSKPDTLTPEKGRMCDYEIELYDTWRE